MKKKALYEIKNTFKNFSKSESEKVNILNNINFTIYEGEIVSIIGPSGSGKSTLLSIMGLLDDPCEGEILYKGQNINCLNKNFIKMNKISFIHQFHHLLSDFNVLENVMIPLLLQKFNYEYAFKKAEEMLNKVGIEKKYFFYECSKLSGGQKQRIAIARGIIHSPSLIFADEPTGSLDKKNRNIIFSLMKNIAKEKNISIVIITHDTEISQMTNRVYFLHEGKLTLQ